jgi:hypothetical protein
MKGGRTMLCTGSYCDPKDGRWYPMTQPVGVHGLAINRYWSDLEEAIEDLDPFQGSPFPTMGFAVECGMGLPAGQGGKPMSVYQLRGLHGNVLATFSVEDSVAPSDDLLKRLDDRRYELAKLELVPIHTAEGLEKACRDWVKLYDGVDILEEINPERREG